VNNMSTAHVRNNHAAVDASTPVEGQQPRSRRLAMPALAPRPWWMAALAAASAGVLVLFGGCATPGDLTAPVKPLSAEQAGLQADRTDLSVDADWWTLFGDERLDVLVRQALTGAPSLQTAQARIAKAQAMTAATTGGQRPQVGLSADVTRQRFTENGIYPAPLGGSVRNLGNVQLGLSWSLDFFGRHKAELQAALGAENAAAADAAAARNMIATQTVDGYVALGRMLAQRQVLADTLKQRTDTLNLIRQRVDAGLDTNVELKQGQGALPDTRMQMAALDEQIALARHQLATLTGQAPNALDTLAPSLHDPVALQVPGTIGADLLGRRPEVVAARWRVEAAAGQQAVARTRFYPDINLTAFVGFNAIGLDNLFESSSRQAAVAPALRLPIFDGGTLRAGLQGAHADVDAAIGQYNAAVLQVTREAADALTSLSSVGLQQREQSQAQVDAEDAYRLAVERYRAGLGSYLIVLDSETRVLAQRRAAVDLRARALTAQVALLSSLGGGFDDQAPPAMARADAMPADDALKPVFGAGTGASASAAPSPH